MSFVHDDPEFGQLVQIAARENGIGAVLIEKLDAIVRRYGREPMEPDTFIRHYEDAAQIIRALVALPVIEMTAAELGKQMVDDKDLAALPTHDHPAFELSHEVARAALDEAYARIAPMYWGPRLPLHETCDTICGWLRERVASRRSAQGARLPSRDTVARQDGDSVCRASCPLASAARRRPAVASA